MLPPNGIRVADGNPHVLAATYDGTTLTAYLDGVPVASNTGAANPITLTGLGLGNQNGYQYNGKIGYASLYDVAHSAAAVASNSAALKARMASLGVTIPAWRNWVMFEGDSITAGQDGTPFGYTAQAAITPYPQGIITAVAGSNIGTMVSREAADNALLQPSPTRNILTVLIGANDLGDVGGASGFVANVKSYCLAMRAAGWKIVVLTVLPRTYSGFNAWRDTVNPLIVADTSFYDAIVRLDLDPAIGCDACAANTTYYNSDGLHPNTTGENAIAADLLPVLTGILQ
jgi:lysophospholipase L1-like esterase